MVTALAHKPLIGLLLTLVAIASGAARAEAQAVEHLDCPSTLVRVCQHAAPAAPEASDPWVMPRDYMRARQARLMKIYSVDINPRDFKLAGYNSATGQLMLTSPSLYPLFGGSYALDLMEARLMTFEVPRALGEALEMDHSTDRVVLRIYFLLESLGRPEAVYCHGDEALTIRGHMMGARLWRSKQAGADSKDETVEVLASFDVPAGRDLASVLGLSIESEARSWPSVDARFNEKALEPLKEEARVRFEQDVELLLMPCLLSALGKGLQKSATLTFEVHFSGRKVRSARVNTDMANFPFLSECAESALGRLEGPDEALTHVRFPVYFNSP